MKKLVIATMLFTMACASDDKDANNGNNENSTNTSNSTNSTNSTNSVDDGGVDQKVIPDLNMDDDAAASCGEGIYPCGVYGTRKGEVIENDVFFGFTDPQTHCKEPELRALDLGTKIKKDFGAWFRKPEGSCTSTCEKSCGCCAKKELLWVMVSAGWCGPCVQEIQEVMGQVKTGAVDPRLDFVDILFEDGDSQPITESFAKNSWAKITGLTFPLLLDPEFKMGKYFDRESVPFNMLVDLSTMKVFYSQTGSNMKMMGQQIQAFFNQ